MEKKTVSWNDLDQLFQEQIKAGGDVWLRVKGNSMFPFLRDGKTLVRLSPIHRPLKKRDIILYQTDHGVVLHRIVRRTETGFITCGDALKAKETVEKTRVMALVTAIGEKARDPRAGWTMAKVGLWNILKPARRYLIAFLRKVGR